MTQARIMGSRIATTLLVALLAGSTFSADAITPPLLQVGQLDSVEIDGRAGESEWADATELGPLIGADGLPADLPVRVRVGWDDRGVVVLWQLEGDPTFKRRDRDGDIWRDDAVEVHLRTGDDGPLHRFAISPGGSIYDARDGDASWDPIWRGLALRGSDGWQAEMRIPFAAIESAAGENVRVNFLLNTAESDGPVAWWAPPGVDEQAAPGYLRLTRQGSPVALKRIEVSGEAAVIHPTFSRQATLRATLFDGDTEVQASEILRSEPLLVTLPDPGRYRLRLAGIGADGELALQRELSLVRRPPLALAVRKRLLGAREVDLTIDGAGLTAQPDAYVIEATGASPVEVQPCADRVATATVDLTACAAGELTITVTALADGTELATETVSFVLPPRPAWAGSARGKHGRLMDPWTPVKVRGDRVHCWDRVYDFGDQPLPARMLAGGANLLAGPISLRARVGAMMRGWDETTLRWVETTDTHAIALIRAQSPLAEARIRAECHYDGLITFDVKIDPVRDQPLSKVEVDIPVAKEFATHLQIADGTREGSVAMSVPGGGWTRAFAPMVALTGRERGLQWICASDAGWALDEPERALRVDAGHDRTRLTFRMLDRELHAGEAFETSFALQATPVRPTPDGWRAANAVTLHGLTATGEESVESLLAKLRERDVRTVVLDDERFRPRPGGLGEAANATLREFADLCHEAGLRLVLVLDDDLTRDPVWEAFRDEVMIAGSTVVDPAGARPCPGGPWANYAVEAAAYAMEHYELDGIHLRAGLTPRECGSVLHGCPAPGEGGPACDLLGARDLMKRLHTVVHEVNPAATLTVESPGGAPAVAAGFADGLVLNALDEDGEPRGVEDFVARGGLRAIGPAVEAAIPQEATAEQVSEAVGLALLHDAAMRPAVLGPGLAAVSATRAAQEQFDLPTAAWRPWWADDAPVTTEVADVLVSTWWRDGEALTAIANRGGTNPVVELEFDRERIELGPWLLGVDLISGRRVPQIGEVLRLRMEPGQTSLVHVRTRHEREVEIDE